MSVSFEWGGMVTVYKETVPMSEDARFRVQGDRSVVNTMAGSYRDIYFINVNFFNCSIVLQMLVCASGAETVAWRPL